MVLFTGATSFTGSWFVRALAASGAEVTATLRSERDAYDARRRERLDAIGDAATLAPSCVFGSEAFLGLLDQGFDVLCHHAADVTNYRSLDFDVTRAVENNTANARTVFARFAEKGGSAVVSTGSVFENGEGLGEDDRPAFSPYGLSKSLSGEILRFWAGQNRLAFSKFVIANPFGPLEEPRFCHYLIETWRKGETASVRTPDYVRDNIHVDLLAQAYAGYVGDRAAGRGRTHFGPMGYVETQGSFAQRFAREMGARLPFPCPLELGVQTSFPEPLVRTNGDRIDPAAFGWCEAAAWDAIAAYYS